MNENIKALATKEEIKTLATKAELKAEQDKIVSCTIETLDVSYFLGKFFFVDDGVQDMFVYQPTLSTLELKKDKGID